MSSRRRQRFLLELLRGELVNLDEESLDELVALVVEEGSRRRRRRRRAEAGQAQ